MYRRANVKAPPPASSKTITSESSVFQWIAIKNLKESDKNVYKKHLLISTANEKSLQESKKARNLT